MIRNKKPLTLRDKFKKLPQSVIYEQVGKVLFNHLSPEEKDKVKEQLVLSLILELEQLQSNNIRLINDNAQLFTELQTAKETIAKLRKRKK